MTAPKLAHTALQAAVSLFLLLAVCPSTSAQRPLTPNEAAARNKTVLTSVYGVPGTPDLTSYGPPVFVEAIKNTSIDHFGAVRPATAAAAVIFTISAPLRCPFARVLQAQYETYNMRYILVWPKTKPNTSSAIYLFCGQEIPLEYVLVLIDNSIWNLLLSSGL